MKGARLRPRLAHAFAPATVAVLTASAPGPARGEEAGYAEPALQASDFTHWAFQPPAKTAPPGADDVSVVVRNPIDAFVLERLGAEGLTLSPQADRRTLVRRLAFDLTGLPPAPGEVDGFLKDDKPGAYRRLVGRLLSSPRFGERWAQHWLDVARFAESDGFEHDKVRGEAWRFRDWVIDALNADMPYDEFVRLQVAGDLVDGGGRSAAVATGFLVCGPDMPDINENDERRHNTLNEMTSAVGEALLGLTFRCASCHDHRSDPLSQADFYRLRAFFEGFAMPPLNKQLPHVFRDNAGGAPVPAHLMVRGDFRRPGPLLAAAFPRVLAPGAQAGPARPEREPSPTTAKTRRELARWLTRADHPLTARVIVNRLWMHHFGSPLVANPNDFGRLGGRPSHPRLLDWLATELVRQGWSLKAMHRLLVESATYRQASAAAPSTGDPAAHNWSRGQQIDPDNSLLWRMNRRRLSGETLRDAMLVIGGHLNEKMGGPGVRPPLPTEVTTTLLKNQWPVTPDASEHTRRSIYLFVRRNLRFPIFEVFDRPAGNASCGRRHVSTTAPQSLTLLNSEFSWKMAQALARRVRAGGGPLDEQVRRAHQWAVGRAPTPGESETAKRLVENAALDDYCLALFNLNAFVFVD